ncbi:Phage-related minor tail protein [Serratia entomophila]|nr:Phage-related minor tail protein [Serratia entomophila]CAI0854212.1 Phage-related minor tail protein [Serratia entomophila]CAI2041550.1 Phage-related minor tail protein [Serratia entomophila]
MRRSVPPFINPVSPRKAVLICSVLTLCECWEMADTALLVVGLQLNDTNFKNKLTAAYRTAGEQSAKFNRQAQQDAKKTDESYQSIGGTLGGLAGKLAGLAGVELSLQGLAATSRQYGQALTELSSVTVAATAQMKQLDEAARQASSTSGEGGSRTEEVLKLAAGLNDSAAAWRDQAAAASGASRATAGVGAASRVANVALGALGGPVGVAIQAGLAMLYFHEQNQLARQSALALKDAVIETVPALALMSDKQLAVKQLDYNEQLKTLFDEKKKLQANETYLKTRIHQANKAGWIGSFLFGKPEDRKDELTRTAADMESMDKAIENTKRNLNNVNAARFSAHTKLGQRVSQFASDVQTMITPDQPKDNEVAAVTPAYSLGRLEADQSGREKQQEQYQKLLQQLAEQYAPGQTTVRKEQEASKELKTLYGKRLSNEREYQTASQMQRQETTRQRLKAETDALAAPRLSIAGDVDPAARLKNQLVQQQAQYQAYYQQGYLDKQRYEQLMQAATQESTDAQYQQALSLYGGQNRVHKMALGLVDMTRERTSGMMFDLLTGTQNFKQNMLGLFSSITQSVVQQLIDIAMQALLTRTILSTFMNIGGGVLGGVASAGAGAAGSGAMGMPTGWQGYVPNARGGVYASPSLSAYSGRVVSSPTLFAFARGAGLMGEAGPEAIMPLKRGADGSLGVRAIGGGQQAAAAPNVYITIENGGNVSTQADAGWGEFGKQMGNIAAQESQKVINRNLMPGQPIWKAIKGM